MGQRAKQTFLQRRHTDGQQTHEKMLSILFFKHKNNTLSQLKVNNNQLVIKYSAIVQISRFHYIFTVDLLNFE